MTPPDDYDSLLASLSATQPQTAALLRAAQASREETLRRFLPGVRLSGFEELIGHLEGVEAKFRESPTLAKIAFLVKRSRAEFGIALEALISGLHTVAHDAMRAVMEIEFLLRDFWLDPSRLDEWVGADPKVVQNKYSPGILRQRFAAYVGKPANELPEAADYKGHSMYLHVGPRQNPFGISGLGREEHPFATDSCFWEIFEHARRLLIALNELGDKLDPGLLADHNPEALERVGKAWERTQEMQQIWFQLIRYPKNEKKDKEATDE